MAINILTEPTDPPVSGDFTRDQAIQHSNEVPNLSILSLWESTAAAPVAKQGAFIRHAGNTFQVQSADETISGTPSAGLNYIIASESAGVITLAWATSLTGYAYNPAYGGIYDGAGNQALRDVCRVVGAAYYRGLSVGMDFDNVVYSGIPNYPIGFVYVQYPTKDSPEDLGLPGTWTNISSEFAGDFFRAEGGDASAFEGGEQAYQNAYHRHAVPGYTGAAGGSIQMFDELTAISIGTYVNTTYSGSSGDPEARPVNMTIRLWERTA